MKRHESSSEALQLFARLNASNLEKCRSGQQSETKIQLTYSLEREYFSLSLSLSLSLSGQQSNQHNKTLVKSMHNEFWSFFRSCKRVVGTP